jgi:hypothetical protein
MKFCTGTCLGGAVAARAVSFSNFPFCITTNLLRLLLLTGIGSLSSSARAQTNSWTSPTSGNWEDLSWSLGILPGANQAIMLTNAGWKAVQISFNTVQNFPQTLNVNSIDISSPTNTFNTLLLNFAGLDSPLTVQSVSVESNSAMTMDSSALQLDGGNGVGMQVGGQFNQNDSLVAGRQVNVGYIGPGVYNMNSGFLAVSNLWVGGQFGGVFNQNGGTNAVGITDVQGGNYILSNGYFAATIYFDGGTFTQQGGLLNLDLTAFQGNYMLAGGLHNGGATVPWTDGFTSGNASMIQTGGTNSGPLDIGSYGYGHYTLSNGISLADSLSVDYEGQYNQWGGTQTVAGSIDIGEQQIAAGAYSFGILNLNGGTISSMGILNEGYYTQGAGTNLVMGDVLTQGVEAFLLLSNGLFTANNLVANAASVGGVFLRGGTLVVTNQFTIGAYLYFPSWQGFVGGSGQLIVSNIVIASGGTFSCGSCAITQSGTLTLTNATLNAGSGSVQFGPLQLSNGGNTNSVFSMPAGASALHFADSRSAAWSSVPNLFIQNWNGSLFGGGQQQIIFGNSSAALTGQQLAQIQFQNPAGLPSGNYPARILATGEIVPNSGGALSAQLGLRPQSNGMLLTVQAQAGHNYRVQVSTDLVHWTTLTNQTNATGTFSVSDTGTTNCPMRFYRTVQLP